MGVEQTICLFIDAISQAQYRCLGSVGLIENSLMDGWKFLIDREFINAQK